MEPGESPEACLKRELHEEFAMETQIGDFFLSSRFSYPEGEIELLAFWAIPLSQPGQLTAHDKLQWVKPSKLTSYRLSPADIPIAEQIQASGLIHPANSEEKAMWIEEQLTNRDIGNPRVLSAMRAVPRHEFVPTESQADAYGDYPVSIGHGQTISQPYIVAYMTQILDPKSDEKILEIGTGSGYQTAILAELAGEVYSIEFISELADQAKERLKRLGYSNIRIKATDGYFGWSGASPFNGIMVTAALDHVPQALMDQLAPGGRMIIPVGAEGYQVLEIISKDADGRIEKRRGHSVRFVPFVHPED